MRVRDEGGEGVWVREGGVVGERRHTLKKQKAFMRCEREAALSGMEQAGRACVCACYACVWPCFFACSLGHQFH